MKPSRTDSPPAGLPVTRDLAPAYALSLAIALVMTVASVAGLLYRSAIYPTDELLRSFVANDVVNLIIGVPILLGSLWYARRGKLVGLLFWPGALMYVLYNYVAYVFGTPLSWAFLSYLALVTSSAYTLIGLVASVDGEAVRRRLAGAVPERLSGGILIGLGILMLVRAVGVIAAALTSRTPVAVTELSVLIADFLLAPASVVGGVLLWRRNPLGYVGGAGLLFQSSMLFIGLIIFLLLQPLLTDAPFALVDVVVIFVMGLICFIPFGLFVRGVMKAVSLEATE
jgi:hypothetical protein